MIVKEALFLNLLFLLPCFRGEPSTSDDPSDVFVTEEEELKQWVIAKCNLNSNTRPVRRHNETLDVTLSMAPYSFRGINAREQSFTMALLVKLAWKHPCVSWGDSESTQKWQHILSFTDSADKFWTMIVYHMNSYSDSMPFLSNSARVSMTFSSDGTVTWTASMFLTSFCALQFKKFPLDSQSCEVALEPDLQSTFISFSLPDDPSQALVVYEKFVSPLEVWTLSSVNASIMRMTYSAFQGDFTRAVFLFNFDRRPWLYVTNIVIPCMFLMALQLAMCFMPAETYYRPSYCVAVLAAFYLMFAIVDNLIPTTSEVPYLIIIIQVQVSINTINTVYSLVLCEIVAHDYFKQQVTLWPTKKAIQRYRLVDLVFNLLIAIACILISIILLILIMS